MGKVEVKTKSSQSESIVVVTGDSIEGELRYSADHIWDGHGTGLITAPGLALKYNNIYGCYRDVEITTAVHSRKNAVTRNIRRVNLVCANKFACN